ncbi:MAG: BamA/TamA family outer membrane protein [Bacteroidales bacterium]|nr:BamA/TamA family outer membrane protein [Bacteroidales bacterium]
MLTRPVSRLRLALRCLLWVALATLTSCSMEKYMEPTDKVLKRNHYDIGMTDGSPVPNEVAAALSGISTSYTAQTAASHATGLRLKTRAYCFFKNVAIPSRLVLPVLRLKTHLYCLANPADSNWLNRYLRREGEPPNIYDANAAYRTAEQLQRLLESKGCFRSAVSFDTQTLKRHDIQVNYRISAAPRYGIESVAYRAADPHVQNLVEQWRDEAYLKAGDYYDQEKVTKERDRLASQLQNEGYYLASKELISFVVDTTYEAHRLSIEVRIAHPQTVDAEGQLHSRPLQKYYLDRIFVYPNGSSETGLYTDTAVVDYHFRGRHTDYVYLFNQRPVLSPHTISNNMLLFHRQLYRPRNTTLTYNSLQNLRNFKYINIEYAESPFSTDSLRLLDASVRLLNSSRRRLSASLELSNYSSLRNDETGNNGDFGTELVFSYQNKNLLGGAELLKVETSLLMELPKVVLLTGGGEFYDNFSAFEANLDMQLDLPKFLLPYADRLFRQQTRPHTLLNLGSNYQYRRYFERALANTSFGYSWSRTRRAQHQLLPIELTYVRFFNIDPAFLSRLANLSNARLKYQYSDHFIMDARYEYTYSGQRFGTRENFNYLHFSAETAGNLLHGLSAAFGAAQDSNGIRQIWGVPYSQYVRLSAEAKRYFYFGEKSTFVTRLLAGAGLPYANSSVMPYEKSFYGGGPTTMRAWQLRHLGPGLYESASTDVLERVGDIQLVLNAELRFPLFRIFEGAAFVDAGNVWLLNSNSEFPGGEMRLSTLPSSIAVGTGLGLRLNVSIITIRADFAIPLYDPGFPSTARWRPPHWRFNQIVTNLGIDYPF